MVYRIFKVLVTSHNKCMWTLNIINNAVTTPLLPTECINVSFNKCIWNHRKTYIYFHLFPRCFSSVFSFSFDFVCLLSVVSFVFLSLSPALLDWPVLLDLVWPWCEVGSKLFPSSLDMNDSWILAASSFLLHNSRLTP